MLEDERLLHEKPSSEFSTVAWTAAEASEQCFDTKYDRKASSGKIALASIAGSIFFSLAFIVFGTYISASTHNVYAIVLPPGTPLGLDPPSLSSTIAIFPNQSNSIKAELLSLVLNLFITIFTESIGLVHAVALKSSLASESQLRWNTNLRLLTATAGAPWTNPNSTFYNVVMALLLIISYAASSLFFTPFVTYLENDTEIDDAMPDIHGDIWSSTCIFATPVIVLGTAILLQAIIALAGISRSPIRTWSSSPLDTTAALIHHGAITPVTNRCMRNVVDDSTLNGMKPALPHKHQPSPWDAHPNVRKIIRVLFSLAIACVAWGGIVYGLWKADTKSTTNQGTPGLDSWALIPDSRSNTFTFGPGYGPLIPKASWFACFVGICVIQGGLTLSLHCAELIVNLVRDENIWRAATSKKGTKAPGSPIQAAFSSWQNMFLLVTKPFLHWMFGLALNVQGHIELFDGKLSQINLQVSMRTVQIWYLAIALSLFAASSTLIARRRPIGPQPAAYGHTQTLANLVDEWSLKMWWGHKSDGETCHAGTSDQPLPPVKMDSKYS